VNLMSLLSSCHPQCMILLIYMKEELRVSQFLTFKCLYFLSEKVVIPKLNGVI